MKDLYQTVNGPWLDSHVIPSDRGVDGTFHALRDKAEEDVHAIVETARASAVTCTPPSWTPTRSTSRARAPST